jgi:purine-binding chemotaxis protein CheW
MEKELHIVGFRVGRETYGVPIKLILEIVRVPEITAVPDAPDHIEGVINLRGKIVSIIDLRKRFREKHITQSRHNRILIMELQGRLAGLVVDGASEVMEIPGSDVEPPPAGFQDSGLQCVTGVAKYGNRLVVLLDIAKLLQREVQGLQAGVAPEGELEPVSRSMAAKAKG